MRERLIELMHEGDLASGTVCDDYDLEFIADYLLDNGVIIPPCNVEDTVYEIYRFCIYGAWEIDEHRVTLEDLPHIGKTVFLTKEEAEAKLAELKGDTNEL